MDRVLAEETLYGFLERRERELESRIEVWRVQVEEMETELAEVRRAKEQLKPPTDGSLGIGRLPASSAERALIIEGRKGIGRAPLPEYVIESLPEKKTRRETDPANMTLRELVLLAFKTPRCLLYGASNRDLRAFIKEASGREVERTSLSPTLARLRDDGVLVSQGDGKWRLAED